MISLINIKTSLTPVHRKTTLFTSNLQLHHLLSFNHT